MYHIAFKQHDRYDVAILVKQDALMGDAIKHFYIEPTGLDESKFIAFSLPYDNPKKVSNKAAKEYLATLLPLLKEMGVKYLYCADGTYFKVLTKQTKAEPHYGYVLPCAIPGYEDMQVILSTNHKSVFFNDAAKPKIELANQTLVKHYNQQYVAIGSDIIHHAEYIPCDPVKIKAALEKLHQYDSLTLDTETFSLRHTKSGLGTIGFAWSKNAGICIDVDHYSRTEGIGLNANFRQVLGILKDFLCNFRGKFIYHNAPYDIKILIYLLWMENLTDTAGLLEGLEVLTRDFEDTKIISYLAQNSCGAPSGYLSLKQQAHEFAGNYAQDDINDITLIKNQDLMKYNLIDCLATWYVFEKNYPLMVKDNQLDVYVFFKKILKNIIQMELTGMPLDMKRVLEVKAELEGIVQKYQDILNSSHIIQDFSRSHRMGLLKLKQAKLKTKILTLADIKYEFNTGSGDQLVSLIHDFLKFEAHEFTPTKQPKVGGKQLKGHMSRTDDPTIKEVLEAIIKIEEGKKILNTFINKFVEADEYDGWHYLFGSFNLGGTKSGRLSSSNPNL